MAASTQGVGDRLLLSPREPLLAGGAAEAFERQLRTLVRGGHKNLVDLGGVTAIDSAGIRALVRGHTSTQRAGGNLRLAAAGPAISHVLEVSHLANIFESYQSENVTIKYHTWLNPQIPLEELSGQLMTVNSGISGVSWEHPKRA